MTAPPSSKPSRSEAGHEASQPLHISADTRAGPLRTKPSRSESGEDFDEGEYPGDHTLELQKLQQLNTVKQAIPSKAAIPDDFFQKKWYNPSESYDHLVAARAQVAVDDELVSDSRPILSGYAGGEPSRPTLGYKPDRSDLKDPNDSEKTSERRVETSQKPSRSEAE